MKLDKFIPEEETLKYVSKNNYLVNPKKFVFYVNELTKGEKYIIYCLTKFNF